MYWITLDCRGVPNKAASESMFLIKSHSPPVAAVIITRAKEEIRWCYELTSIEESRFGWMGGQTFNYDTAFITQVYYHNLI